MFNGFSENDQKKAKQTVPAEREGLLQFSTLHLYSPQTVDFYTEPLNY